jgi:hypothetical protein
LKWLHTKSRLRARTCGSLPPPPHLKTKSFINVQLKLLLIFQVLDDYSQQEKSRNLNFTS